MIIQSLQDRLESAADDLDFLYSQITTFHDRRATLEAEFKPQMTRHIYNNMHPQPDAETGEMTQKPMKPTEAKVAAEYTLSMDERYAEYISLPTRIDGSRRQLKTIETKVRALTAAMSLAFEQNRRK